MGESRREETERRPDEGPHERRPLGYYYDDGTGYEVYRPEEDYEDEGDDDGGKDEDGAAKEGDDARHASRS
jgi:hypothetical protein